ncbi:MAG: hypothetical protein ACOC71_00370 [Hyphomicrobiales bacterium]
MDFRNLALGRLIFLTLWAIVCGPLSGFTMGLFFLVYQDGYRKGVLPPQEDQPLRGFLGTLPQTLTSRLSSSAR